MIRYRVVALLIVVSLASAPSAMACATCFGESDSPMAQGMNWGIFTLLVVVASVLAAIAGFFAFIARRAAQGNSSLSSPEQHLHEND